MTKKDILRISGCKSESEFYGKYKTQKDFEKAFPKAKYGLKADAGFATDGEDEGSGSLKDINSGYVNNFSGQGPTLAQDPKTFNTPKNHPNRRYSNNNQPADRNQPLGPNSQDGDQNVSQGQGNQHTGDGLMSGGYQEDSNQGHKYQLNKNTWNPFKKDNAWNPSGGVNTNDIIAGGLSLISGALPYQQPIHSNALPIQPIVNPNAHGIRGSEASVRYGGEIPKAENGLDYDAWNKFQQHSRQTPGYGTDTANHGDWAQKNLQSFNQSNPNQQINPNDVQKYQKDFASRQGTFGSPIATQGTAGIVKADNYAGRDTTAFYNPGLITEHKDAKGNVISHNEYAPNQFNKGAQDFATSIGRTQTAPSINNSSAPQFVGNGQSPQSFTPNSIVGNQPANPAFPTSVGSGVRRDTTLTRADKKENRQKGKIEGKALASRTKETMAAQREYAAPGEAKYGKKIPKAADGLHIEDNQFVPLSDKTLALTGKTHEQKDSNGETGTKVHYNGVTVEGQGNGSATKPGEPISIGKDGSLHFWGKMPIPGHSTTFEQVGKMCGKMEKKNEKLQDKAVALVNNNNPKSSYGKAPSNTGKILMDAAAQTEQHIEDYKEKFAQMQNDILDMAKKYNADPKKMAKALGGRAKYGASIPKAESGADSKDIEERQKNLQSSPKYAEAVAKMKEDHPDWGTDKVKDNKYWGKRDKYIDSYITSNTPTQKATFHPDKTFNPDDFQDLPQQKPLVINSPEIPTTGKWNPPYKQQENTPESHPITRPKSRYSPKLGIMDYAGELAELFDQPQPVPVNYYNPQLQSPYSVSFADRLQANQADFNALAQTPHNAGEMAALSAQKYNANNTVMADEFRTNQGIKAGVDSSNINTLNEAQRFNLGLNEKQLDKEALAYENTRSNKLAALTSIANKEGQIRHDRALGQMYSDIYGDTYSPSEGFTDLKSRKLKAETVSVSDTTPTKKSTSKKRKSDGSVETTEKVQDEAAMGGSVGGGGFMSIPGMSMGTTSARYSGSIQNDKKKKKHKYS